MMHKILNLLFSIFSPNLEYTLYTNQRSNIIKNGGCIIRMYNRTIAHYYAIVDSCGAVVGVFLQGILASFFRGEMEELLMEFMISEEEKKENPRALYYNQIDTPLR